MLGRGWRNRGRAPDGTVRADAYVLDARLTGGEAVGSPMIEVTLEVRPRHGVPFQVRRKFVGAMSRIETGQKLEVTYDPANPDNVELT